MTQYDNILKALGDNAKNGLTPQQKADNYTAFQRLMEDGIYLPDILKRIDDLEKKVDKIRPQSSELDSELFAVMESAVRDDPDVKHYKSLAQAEKTRVIGELCIKDEKYRKAIEEYRRAVNAAYIRSREEGRGKDNVLRKEPQGKGAAEKDVQDV